MQSAYVEHLARRLREAEEDLAREVEQQQVRWHYRLNRGRVWFSDEMRQAHGRLKQSIPAFVWHASPLNLLTAPVIYSLLLPLVLLDTWVTIYQWVCFPIYGMSVLRRRDYFIIDRGKLAYLNAIEKANCTFCSYANGLIAYVREVAALTEQYWCPIKHARPIRTPHSRYHLFFDYGDGKGYRYGLEHVRRHAKTVNRGRIQLDEAAPGNAGLRSVGRTVRRRTRTHNVH
jgi:hypothetical protein